MEDEHGALLANRTWDLVPRPPRANVVTGKWIFKHKFQADGSLERYKARWVMDKSLYLVFVGLQHMVLCRTVAGWFAAAHMVLCRTAAGWFVQHLRLEHLRLD
jgi:hypothetical protein